LYFGAVEDFSFVLCSLSAETQDVSLGADCVKTPFMVSFDFAQDKLAHHER
jgi:hypothetical protein